MSANSFAYSLCVVLGVIAAAAAARLLPIPGPPAGDRESRNWFFIAGLAGMLLGAKIPVWLSYGFRPELYIFGKSVMGGILGAFIAINVYKYALHRRGEAFGGRFAIPLAIAVGFGKTGCWLNGCCAGTWLVPAQLLESAFQFAAAIALYFFYRRTRRADLLFPLYLLAYLVMRFSVEFIRTEPAVCAGLTVYQLLALAFAPCIAWIIIRRILCRPSLPR